MARYRLILPQSLEHRPLPKVIEKEDYEISADQLKEYNNRGYNIYYFPNHNSKPISHHLSAKDVDKWEWVFVDFDLKDGIYPSLTAIADTLHNFAVPPTKTIKTGHGIHAYWRISDLTMTKYLEIQKALIAKFKSDKSIWTITQLMRLEGYFNTKSDPWVMAKPVKSQELNTDNSYTCEQLLEHLDPLSPEDLRDIQNHVNKYIHGIEFKVQQLVLEPLPERFLTMLERRPQLHGLFYNPEDRSKADIKIANILQVAGFNEEEARNILAQTQKGQERGAVYVDGIVRKVWDNPLDPLDSEYEEISKDYKFKLLEEIKQENYEYKLTEENKRVKAAKEEDKKRGAFSFRNTKEIRKKIYKETNAKNDECLSDVLTFVTDRVTQVVPLYGFNVVLVAGESGNGKSSLSANICLPLMQQGKRICYISTEERGTDIMTRIVALKRGWNIQNRRNWTDNMKMARDEEIEKLVDDDKLVVVDSYTPDTTGNIYLDITSKEGFITALSTIEKEEEKFDLLVVDYISKVNNSIKRADAQEYLILEEVTRYIEEWGKRNNTPSVVFTQLKPALTETTQFEMRLPGSKRVLRYVTVAIEMKTDYEAKTCTLICHKNRDEGNLFRKTLRYEKGKYVDCPSPEDSVEETSS